MNEPWCTCGIGEFQPPEMHADSCPGSNVDNVRAIAPAPAAYGANEKVASLLDAMQTHLAGDSSRTAKLIRNGFKWARWSGLADQFTSSMPSLDDRDGWDQRLTLAVGLALALMSDDYKIDVDAARAIADQVLGQFFANLET